MKYIIGIGILILLTFVGLYIFRNQYDYLTSGEFKDFEEEYKKNYIEIQQNFDSIKTSQKLLHTKIDSLTLQSKFHTKQIDEVLENTNRIETKIDMLYETKTIQFWRN